MVKKPLKSTHRNFFPGMSYKNESIKIFFILVFFVFCCCFGLVCDGQRPAFRSPCSLGPRKGTGLGSKCIYLLSHLISPGFFFFFFLQFPGHSGIRAVTTGLRMKQELREAPKPEGRTRTAAAQPHQTRRCGHHNQQQSGVQGNHREVTSDARRSA